jgi:hypothetical protein
MVLWDAIDGLLRFPMPKSRDLKNAKKETSRLAQRLLRLFDALDALPETPPIQRIVLDVPHRFD